MTDDGVTVRESPIHGLGVFAACTFGAGERALELDDSRVVDANRPLDPGRGEHGRHCDYLTGGEVVLMPELLPLLEDWFVEEHRTRVERLRRVAPGG